METACRQTLCRVRTDLPGLRLFRVLGTPKGEERGLSGGARGAGASGAAKQTNIHNLTWCLRSSAPHKAAFAASIESVLH